MIVRLHELRLEDRHGSELTFSPDEAAHLARLALASTASVLAVAWSAREIDVVSEAGPGEAGEDSVLIPVFSSWRSWKPSRYSELSWEPTAADPSEWDWALPSAETWARRLLGGRHQCAPHGDPAEIPWARASSICECGLRGVRCPSDAAAKGELGVLARPEAASREPVSDDRGTPRTIPDDQRGAP